MALVRLRRQEEQQLLRCHILRLFSSWSYRLWLAMICSMLTTSATATSDGNAIVYSSSSSSGRFSMPTFTVSMPKRDILGMHNVNSLISSRFARCCVATSSSLSSCIGFIQKPLRPPWPTTTTTTTTAKRAFLSIRGGGGVSDDGGIIVSSVTAILTSIGESKTKCWILLIVCILAETWATSLSKTARDEKSPGIFAASLVLYSACMLGFNVALSKIEVGIAYAVWSALGTLVVTYIGIVCFGESFDLYKLLCLALIVVGVIGLNIREDHQ